MSELISGNVAISVDLKKHRIRIYKTVIHALGDPAFILLLVNPEDRSICISCGDPNDKRAHRVRLSAMKSGSSFELYSKSLCVALMEVCPEWNNNQSYRFYGEMIPGIGSVRFSLENAINISLTGAHAAQRV